MEKPEVYLLIGLLAIPALVSERRVPELRAIEVVEFVDLDEAQPYGNHFSLSPQGIGVRAFAIILEAMKQASVMAIANLVYPKEQFTATIRPFNSFMTVECGTPAVYMSKLITFPSVNSISHISDKELELALTLIDQMMMK